MYARATTHRASPEPVEEAIVHYEGGIPSLREIVGNRGAFLLVDRSAGRAIGVTHWESEEAMRRADELRQQPVPESGEVDEYEVAVWAISRRVFAHAIPSSTLRRFRAGTRAPGVRQ